MQTLHFHIPGTPLVLQLMIVYYGLPQVLGFDIDAYWAAVIAFGLNSAAYVSEIIRAGINAIDKGQKRRRWLWASRMQR